MQAWILSQYIFLTLNLWIFLKLFLNFMKTLFWFTLRNLFILAIDPVELQVLLAKFMVHVSYLLGA